MVTFYDYRINPTVGIRNKLVEQNIGLARSVAHKIKSMTPLPYEDIEQLAFLHLILAVERYDLTRGAAFSTFAVPLIQGRVLNFLRDESHIIRLPRRYHEILQKGKKTLKELSALGRTPTKTEFFQALLEFGITQLEFSKAKKAYQDCRYIACYDTAISSVLDTINTDAEPNNSFKICKPQNNETHSISSLEKEELKSKMQNILKVDIADLTYQEAVVRLYFFEYLSFNKIAKMLEMTQEQIIEDIKEWCKSV